MSTHPPSQNIFLDMAEVGSENNGVVTPPVVRRFDQIHPVQPSRSDTDRRFVIFNTGGMSAGEAKDNLREMLTPESFVAFVSVRSVQSRNLLPRLEVEVTAELGEALKRQLHQKTDGRTAYMLRVLRSEGILQPLVRQPVAMKKWRMVAYRSYFDRPPAQPQQSPQARLLSNCFISLNVNGFHRKKYEVENVLMSERAMVMSLQETLVAEKHYPVVVKGYRAFNKPKQEGFRGHTLLVDSRMKSYELPHVDSKHLIHVKICGVQGSPLPAHVISVYLPSGGNVRRECTRLLKALGGRVRAILKTDQRSVIVCLGDFNIERDALQVKLKKHIPELSLSGCTGSPWTRFPTARGSRCASLDHVLLSGGASALFQKQRVLRQYPISDHRPVVSRLRQIPQVDDEAGYKVPTRISTGACRVYGKDVVNHNKWSLLAVEEADPMDEDLAGLVNGFARVFDATARALGVKSSVPAPGKGARLPRKLKDSLQRLKKLVMKVTAARAKGAVSPHLNGRYLKACARHKKLKAEWRTKEKYPGFSCGPHHGTNWAALWLTSQIRRDVVLSKSYGRG